jgi:hypothetical protein
MIRWAMTRLAASRAGRRTMTASQTMSLRLLPRPGNAKRARLRQQPLHPPHLAIRSLPLKCGRPAPRETNKQPPVNSPSRSLGGLHSDCLFALEGYPHNRWVQCTVALCVWEPPRRMPRLCFVLCSFVFISTPIHRSCGKDPPCTPRPCAHLPTRCGAALMVALCAWCVLFVFCGFAALQAGLARGHWGGLQRLVLIACLLAACFLGVFVSCGLR